MNRITKDQSIINHAKIKELHATGKYKQAEIARMVGISYQSVSWFLKNRPVVYYKYGRRNYGKTEPYRKMKQLALDKLGNVCVKCGFSDSRALQIDHISGEGFKDRKNGIRGYATYKDVLNSDGKYQLLCANCNWIKRHENKEFRVSTTNIYDE